MVFERARSGAEANRGSPAPQGLGERRSAEPRERFGVAPTHRIEIQRRVTTDAQVRAPMPIHTLACALALVLPGAALAAPPPPAAMSVDARELPPPRLVAPRPCAPSFDTDPRTTKLEHVRSAGFTTMIVGTSVAAIAAMIIPIGFVAARRNLDEHDACSDSGNADCSGSAARARHGSRAMYSGIVLFGLGVHALVAGGITYGVANARLRRAQRVGLRSFAFTPLRSGLGFGASGRF